MCEQKQTPPVKVEVKNLTKKFGDLLVLDNISFDVYQGDLLCVVGPTGCGKTSLLHLITRFYDVTGGSVTVDGVDVRQMPQSTLRGLLGYVPQKGVLFSGTIDSNLKFGGEGTKLYSTANSNIKKLCLENNLHLLDAQVRHLGTDINYVVLTNLYNLLSEKIDFMFSSPVKSVALYEGEGDARYTVTTDRETYSCKNCVISVGRSGSKWMETVCEDLEIPTKSNRVDIGVRVELPAVIFSHLTDELYESKIVYRTEKFEDNVRTFCMNPYGIVVNENTNGIVTV